MEQVDLGRERTPEDGCRRYRPIEISFDLTVRTLTAEVGETWEEPIRQQYFANQNNIRESLIARFGLVDYQAKIDNYIALDVAPISIVSTHNNILTQCRNAFVTGLYYPALLGVAGLGERILNELLLQLRDDHKGSEHYKKIYNKGSVDDWDLATKILRDWTVIDEDTAALFGKLKKLRNESVHYQNQTLHLDARAEALQAIQLIQGIVDKIFSPFTLGTDSTINVNGIMFLRRAVEQTPLIRRFYLPGCALVSPNHAMQFVGNAGHVTVEDDVDYALDHPEHAELTDEQFADASANPAI